VTPSLVAPTGGRTQRQCRRRRGSETQLFQQRSLAGVDRAALAHKGVDFLAHLVEDVGAARELHACQPQRAHRRVQRAFHTHR